MEAAARVAFETVLDVMPKLSTVTHIRFVLYSAADLKTHRNVLAELT